MTVSSGSGADLGDVDSDRDVARWLALQETVTATAAALHGMAAALMRIRTKIRTADDSSDADTDWWEEKHYKPVRSLRFARIARPDLINIATAAHGNVHFNFGPNSLVNRHLVGSNLETLYTVVKYVLRGHKDATTDAPLMSADRAALTPEGSTVDPISEGDFATLWVPVLTTWIDTLGGQRFTFGSGQDAPPDSTTRVAAITGAVSWGNQMRLDARRWTLAAGSARTGVLAYRVGLTLDETKAVRGDKAAVASLATLAGLQGN